MRLRKVSGLGARDAHEARPEDQDGTIRPET
jgi:hypothetical protein